MSSINSTTYDFGMNALPSAAAGLEHVRSALETIQPGMSSAAKSTMGALLALPQYLTWSLALNVILLTFIAFNIKAIPLVYHLRILNGVRHMLKSQRSSKPLTPDNLFQPLITSSRSPLMESDVYGHKNNNTYFTDHDIARTHLLSTLFSKGIENVRGSVTMNGLSGKTRSKFTIPLGATTCSFRKEIKPYEAYDMWTRILSWDKKWIYVVTHFVKKGAKIEPEEFTLYTRQNSSATSIQGSRQNSIAGRDTRRGSVDDSYKKEANSAIAASAMSKVVFKNGRITIAPEVMLEASGLLPKSTIQKDDKLAQAQIRANDDAEVSPFQAVRQLEKVEDSDSASDSGYESSRAGSTEQLRKEWTREEIEAERVRGLRLAQMLAGLSDLEHELNSDVALGRHYDGNGIEGVVATLLQLGKFSNYQLV